LAKEYKLTQAETSFAELGQEEQRKRSQEWAMLLAMAAMPTIDTALYGKSGTIYGNNVYDNLESQGTQGIYKGSTMSWKPSSLDDAVIGGGSNKLPKASDLKNTQTVQNKMVQFVKKGPYKGEPIRPYIDTNGTNTLVGEIMGAGNPVKDKFLNNGLRWDVSGTFRGSNGKWELVVDLDTNTIVHFNFTTK
jgi:hypothetical protein